MPKKHLIDLGDLNKEERNAIETIVMGLLTKRILAEQRIEKEMEEAYEESE